MFIISRHTQKCSEDLYRWILVDWQIYFIYEGCSIYAYKNSGKQYSFKYNIHSFVFLVHIIRKVISMTVFKYSIYPVFYFLLPFNLHTGLSLPSWLKVTSLKLCNPSRHCSRWSMQSKLLLWRLRCFSLYFVSLRYKNPNVKSRNQQQYQNTDWSLISQ